MLCQEVKKDDVLPQGTKLTDLKFDIIRKK